MGVSRLRSREEPSPGNGPPRRRPRRSPHVFGPGEKDRRERCRHGACLHAPAFERSRHGQVHPGPGASRCASRFGKGALTGTDRSVCNAVMCMFHMQHPSSDDPSGHRRAPMGRAAMSLCQGGGRPYASSPPRPSSYVTRRVGLFPSSFISTMERMSPSPQ